MSVFRKLTTNSGRILFVRENFKKRTFTIKTDVAKYTTSAFSKEEFSSAYYWTGNDWNHFLKTSNNYF